MPDPQTDTDAARPGIPPERTGAPGRSLPDAPAPDRPAPAGGDAAESDLTAGAGPGFDVEEAAAYRENDA